MNFRWFYLLLINVVVLFLGVLLFTDKAQLAPNNLAFNVDKSQTSGISSIDGFHFVLNDPLASQEQDLKPQLSSAQKTISEKNLQITNIQKKSAQQSKQVTQLEKRNNKLQQQLFLLNAELDRRDGKLVKKQQVIDLLVLEQELKENNVFKTDIELIKESIQSKPDLVTLTPPPETQATTIEKEALLDDERFSGSVEFGFTYEQDNQVTKAIKGRLILDYDELEKYNINSDLDFEFKNVDEETSIDKYRWQLQSDYNLDPVNFVYARSDISRNKFSSYEEEDIFTLGYGHIFFNTEKHKLNVEFGPGYRSAIPKASGNALSIDEFIVRTRLNYERVVSDSLQIKVESVLEAGHSNSVYSMGFRAQNRIYQELYLIFDFEYKYTENVPVDTVHKEISTGFSLLYAF